MKVKNDKLDDVLSLNTKMTDVDYHNEYELHYVGNSYDVPPDEGIAVLIKNKQIAIFNFASIGKWFAVQNECPHKKQMILSRGILGTCGTINEPKVSCPYHKKNFSLITGKCISDESYTLKTYPIFIIDEKIYIGIRK